MTRQGCAASIGASASTVLPAAMRSCGRRGPARLTSTSIEIDLDHVREARRRLRIEPEALPLGVFLHETDVIGAAARLAQIAQRLVVDGEEAGIGAEFRGHVGDDGAVAGGQRRDALAIELDEAIREIDAPKALGHREREIGGEHALPQTAL